MTTPASACTHRWEPDATGVGVICMNCGSDDLTPASAEPTEGDVQAAYELLRDDFPESCFHDDLHFRERAAVDRLARLLASQRAEIVSRYEKVAVELTTLAGQASRPGGGFPFETGVRITAEDAAKRIREAAPK